MVAANFCNQPIVARPLLSNVVARPLCTHCRKVVINTCRHGCHSIPNDLYYPSDPYIPMFQALEFDNWGQLKDWLQGIKFNCKLDECYLHERFEMIKQFQKAFVTVDEFHGSKIVNLQIGCQDVFNNNRLLEIRITSYDDGLSYITNGYIFVNDICNTLVEYKPTWGSPNFDYYISFKFIHAYADTESPDSQFTNAILRIIAQHIINRLSQIGFACETTLFNGLATIRIQIVKYVEQLHKYLLNLDWKACLQSLNNIISFIQLKSDYQIITEIDLQSTVNNGLIIELTRHDDAVMIELRLTNKSITSLFNDRQVYDGWEFMPLWQHVYSNPKWNIEPIYDFQIYGLKQIFKIHDKYLPLRSQVVRIDGFKINGNEYYFMSPQYVGEIRGLDCWFWNKQVLMSLRGD
jgi:hypothetical protein